MLCQSVQSQLCIVLEDFVMCRDLIFIWSFVLLYVFRTDSILSASNQLSSTGKVQVDFVKVCASMHCDSNEHCISRKFWCKNPPCPSMLYCSKTLRESMKGPMTCNSVRCSKGYICMVKVRGCRWDQRCKQQIVRCVSEREYYDGPASCANFHCPLEHQCILKESLCAHAPCKLIKSCAKTKDVQIWHERCRNLGCPSEYECFLRRPSDHCHFTDSCKHTPDCTTNNDKEIPMNPDCRGWVCPRDQECSALPPEFCKSNNDVGKCEVKRACHGPLAIPNTTTAPSVKILLRYPTAVTEIQDSSWQSDNSKPFKSNQRHSTKETKKTIVHTGRAANPSHTECKPNDNTVHGNWGTLLKTWNPQIGSIYRVPVYVRSTMNRNSVDGGESLQEKQLTDRSIMQWLDHLRLKTGVDAINLWTKHAEEDKKYEQFKEWLTAVRIVLGPERFNVWLKEIQKLTAEYPAFQKWLVKNEEIPSFHDSKQRTSTEIDEQKEKYKLDDEDVHETTESPANGYQTLMFDYNGSSTLQSPKGEGQNFDDVIEKHKIEPGTPRDIEREVEIEKIEHQKLFKNLDKGFKDFVDSRPQPLSHFQLEIIPDSLVNPETDVTTAAIITPPTIPDQPHRGIIPHPPDQDIQMKKDFHPFARSGNDQRVFFNDQKRPDLPLRKNTGHPRINYAWNPTGNTYRSYKHHRNFRPGELQNETLVWYKINKSADHLPTEKYKPDEKESQDRVNPVNHSPQFDGMKHEDVPNLEYPREYNIKDINWILQNSKDSIFTPEKQNYPSHPFALRNYYQKPNLQESSIDMQEPSALLVPLKNWYQWNRVTPRRPSPTEFTELPLINPHDASIIELQESLKEYVDAYVDTFIEDAISKVILAEEHQKNENPVLWTNSEKLGPLSKDFNSAVDESFRGEHVVDSLQKSHFPQNKVKTITKDEKYNIDPYTLKADQSVNDSLTNGQQITTALTPDSSTDSIIAEIDYQLECEDQETNPSPTIKTKEKSSSIDDTFSNADYYSQYFDESLGYQDQYLTGLGINLTDYDFRYYDYEDYDKVLPENTDQMEENSYL